jgi:hypothetical protein
MLWVPLVAVPDNDSVVDSVVKVLDNDTDSDAVRGKAEKLSLLVAESVTENVVVKVVLHV